MSSSTAQRMETQKSRVVEEDDLDDLDDVLDQFEQPTKSVRPPSANAPTTTASQPAADTGTEALSDDLAAELAREMESLLSSLSAHAESGADGIGDGPTEQEHQRQRDRMAAAWEAMLVDDMNAMLDQTASTSDARTPAHASSQSSGGVDFQSRIRSTHRRLRESESGLQPPPSDASASGAGDTLQSFLSQLGDLGEDGPQSEEQLQGVLEEMMGQLMGKDVLYEPLKELHEKFPTYLVENASTISPQDKQRYGSQITCIKRLIDEFDTNTYRDDDEGSRERIVALMNELQSYGQPPAEIMGPLPPGFNLGVDGLPEIPDGCNMS